MTLVAKWSGDNIEGFDTNLSQINDAFTYANTGGETRLDVTGTGTRILGWSGFDGAPLLTHSFRISFSLSTFNNVLVGPLDYSGDPSYRVIIPSSGKVQVNNAANAFAGQGAETLTVDTDYTLIGYFTTTQFSITLYAGKYPTAEDQIESFSGSSSFGNLGNFRIGQINPNPGFGTFTIHNVALYNDINTPLPVAPVAVDDTKPRVGIIGDSLTAMGNTSGVGGSSGTYFLGPLAGAGIPTRNVYYWGIGGKKLTADDFTGRDTVTNISDAVTQLGEVDQWIIALGTNNTADTSSAITAAVETVLAAIPDDTPVHWIGVTYRPITGSLPALAAATNTAIQAGFDARTVFADWGSYIHNGRDETGLWGGADDTHMSPTGYALRSQFYVDQLVQMSGSGVSIWTAGAELTCALSIWSDGSEIPITSVSVTS